MICPSLPATMSNPDLMAIPQDNFVFETLCRGGITYCPSTGVPWDDCRCESCEADDAPATLPNLPVATPVTITHAPRQKDPEPPLPCSETYYGTNCTNMNCERKHRLPRKDYT